VPVFDDPLELITPFGPATCTERIDLAQSSFWVCWPKETSICFWFLNQEVRYAPDWSDKRYAPLPFKLDPKRVEALDPLGQLHAYWRENIKPGRKTRR
jgi:hypothetical protein